VSFSGYVGGRSVALVGPAAPVGDQSAEVDGHDLVARVNFSTFKPAGYGDRCDIAYFNGGLGRTVHDDGAAWGAHEATWWVFKLPRGHRVHGLYRRAVKCPIRNPNAITMALYDLLQMGAGSVTVYGADLYANPGEHYHPDYPNARLNSTAALAQAIRLHRPEEQRRVHRWAVGTGKVLGDARYLAAVRMTDAEYRQVLARWAALEEAT
jgi:hypothetical protein